MDQRKWIPRNNGLSQPQKTSRRWRSFWSKPTENIQAKFMCNGFNAWLGLLDLARFLLVSVYRVHHGSSIRFPHPLYVPIDFTAHSWIVYGMVYIFLCIPLHNLGQLVISSCLLLNSLFEHISDEFQILRIMFEKALDNGQDEDTILLITSIQRASQPVKVTALGFTNISYESFVNVSRTY